MLDRRDFLLRAGALAIGPALAHAPVAAAVETAPAPAKPLPEGDDPRFWAKLRKEFLLRDDEVFLNTATLGSSPRVVVDAVTRAMRDQAATVAEWDYQPGHPAWFTGYDPENRIREKLAALVHASREEIALTQNATMGTSFVAMGLDLSPGDEVIQCDQEHVGAKSSWQLLEKRRKIAWKTVALPVPANDPDEIVERVRGAITDRTRVIAWPHITSALGTVMPVERICALGREHGILTVIDGAQAIGQVPIDLQAIGCDAYFSSPHKWLLAPAGNGFLYVRRESAGRIWTTLASGEWANEQDPGYRFQQRGTGNLALLLGLEAAIDFHQRVGPARWTGRIKQLGDRLRQGLSGISGVRIASSTHPAMCAGMTTWRLEGHSPRAMMDELWRRARLRPRAVSEDWGLRTSTAIYNSEKELDRLLEVTRDLARAPAG